MDDGKQPPRGPDDGPIEVRRDPHREGWWQVSVSTPDGKQTETLRLSGFNAWRVFGLLAFMLGIPLPAKLQKEIKLG